MASFFSLGGGEDAAGSLPHHSLFLSAAAAAAARSCSETGPGLELWHQPHSSGLLSFFSSPSGVGGREGMGCQDCGNQAKDCAHQRCRTCCHSRGLACSTHVKSTWVPAAKRRERQQQQQQVEAKSKRPRDMIIVGPRISRAAEAAGPPGFPAEVSSPAVFRCMRVSPLDAAGEELAYQTAVSIGGHVFRGILYDHGRDAQWQEEEPSGGGCSTGTAGLVETVAPISAFMAGAGTHVFARP